MIAHGIAELGAELGKRLVARRWKVVTAESCTGGLVAAAITSVAGSSDWFDRGFVTYSDEAKTALLKVPASTLAGHGAVSQATAAAMADGALAVSGADLAVAVTGIAGPGGGTPEKPVGLVWLAVAWCDTAGAVSSEAECRVLPGDRNAVRSATVQWGLERLLALIPG